MASAAEVLDTLTIDAELYESLPDEAVRCYACAHRCLIRKGRRGICQVRFNRDGKLRVPWGYVAALQADPIEKKPFNHFLPGSDALTFGMLGCDFHCDYCQNYFTSQTLRDPASDLSVRLIRKISPEQVVSYARQAGAKVIASSYNEPLITSEWAVAIFRLAREAGLQCVYISNGNATPEVLSYLRPYVTGYKIDLKTMQDRQYRQLGGVLQHVLDSIKLAYQLGFWVEVVTLIVPGFNDSIDELMDTARYIHSVSPDIPWHVTAFHPDYKMQGVGYTPRPSVIRAAEIGEEAGLHYVYAGNLGGYTVDYEDTRCPNCQAKLIQRAGYSILDYRITAMGKCPDCQTPIPGVWSEQPASVRKGGTGRPRLIRS